jgi:DNA-binding NtrC family response regulator
MRNILVIDDQITFLETLCLALEEEGFQAVGVSDADRAFKLCTEFSFDVILCDLCMADNVRARTSFTVGLNLILKLMHRFPNIPVVAMSGALDFEAMSSLEKMGVKHWLSKPFRQGELLEILSELKKRPLAAG